MQIVPYNILLYYNILVRQETICLKEQCLKNMLQIKTKLNELNECKHDYSCYSLSSDNTLERNSYIYIMYAIYIYI